MPHTNIIRLAVIGIVSLWNVTAVLAEDSVPVKIALVYTPPDHPYSTHMYEQDCNLLASCLKQTPNVVPSVSKEWPANDQLENVRTIVFYSRPAGDIVLNPAHREKFEKMMKNGVGFAAIHWATGVEVPLGDEFSAILGGWFNFAHSHLRIETHMLEQQDPQHPICRGWKPYELHDEFYCSMKFYEQTKPVLKVKVDGKDEVVTWTLERSNSHDGRSFGTTLAHFHENYCIDDFRKMLVNGILWSAHVEVPSEGAPVAATDEQLKLPPQK